MRDEKITEHRRGKQKRQDKEEHLRRKEKRVEWKIGGTILIKR